MFKSSSSMMAALLLLFVTPPLCQGQKIDGKVDLVVILPNFGPHPEIARDWKNAVLQHLPRHFEMGEQKTRVAVIDVGEYQDQRKRVVLNLTGDRTAFDSVLQQWTAPVGREQQFRHAFKAARERVFDFDNAERARVILGIKYYAAGNTTLSISEAAKLRNKGVSIYVIYTNTDVDTKNYTGGDPTKTIQAADSVKFHTEAPALLEKMAKVIFRDLCGWDTTCRYPDVNQSQCEPRIYRPKVSIGHNADPNNDCARHEPNMHRICTPDDCVNECDQRWEWSGPLPNCNITCGVVVKRKNATPPEEMENCLPEVQCEPCPTTTVPTTTIATTKTTSEVVFTTTTAASTTPDPGMSPQAIGVAIAMILMLLLIAALIPCLLVRKLNRAAGATQTADAIKKKAAVEAVLKSKVKAPLVKVEEVPVGWAPVMKAADASVAADISLSVARKPTMSSMVRGGKSTTSKKPGGGPIANVKKPSVMTKKMPALQRK